ncbi:DUF6360 family protein [Haloterrigena alkaliphila]|uniref:Uncharacterized protein n=1 Tax=Haloterrigena alkaliphila TaxID=2816475 RepID=A0A8A2VJE3_9EURY|nr:DUF6360 family protein [Haloterrigena alkaliphila]QSX00453.1 DUF6360 family protein [Haloterrigena alkaliphila]
MSNRLISVTGWTTLDYVEAVATGQDFEWESVAVVNATADRDDPDCVHLQLELDNRSEEHLPQHMTDLELAPEQARALATDLEKHADRVEDVRAEE